MKGLVAAPPILWRGGVATADRAGAQTGAIASATRPLGRLLANGIHEPRQSRRAIVRLPHQHLLN